jgi:hypothetical protein
MINLSIDVYVRTVNASLTSFRQRIADINGIVDRQRIVDMLDGLM